MSKEEMLKASEIIRSHRLIDKNRNTYTHIGCIKSCLDAQITGGAIISQWWRRQGVGEANTPPVHIRNVLSSLVSVASNTQGLNSK